MTVRGTVAYPVTQDASQLFTPPGATRTLYNAGPSKVWVSTTNAVKPGAGIPLSKQASIPWDADKACHACTDGLGQLSTILTVDNAGQINDPAALAALIAGGTVDAQAIADAIAASGLTSPGIAQAIDVRGLNPNNIAAAIAGVVLTTAINGTVGLNAATLAALETINAIVAGTVALDGPTLAALETTTVLGPLTNAELRAAAVATIPTLTGTPVVLQRLGLASSVGGSSAAFDDVWVDGVKDNGGWDVPAGKKLVVQLVTVEIVNAGVVAMAPRIQLVEDGAARVFHVLSMRVDASSSRGVVQPITPGAVVVPAGVDLRVKDITGVVGVTFDVTINGTLF